MQILSRSSLAALPLCIAAALPVTAQAPSGPASRSMVRAGEPGQIAGAIVAAESGRPLASAAVRVRALPDTSLKAEAVANAEGRFRVAGLPPGRYRVQVSSYGYASPPPREVAVTTSSPKVELGTLPLTVDPLPLKAVEATAEHPAVVVTPDRTIYTASALPAAAGGTAADLLRQIPELAVDADGTLSLRGSASVAIHLKGRPAAVRGQALQAYLQQLPADRIERIEVVPNPSAREDPEGMAGIVNLVLKREGDLGGSGAVSAYAGTHTSGTYLGLADQSGRRSLFGNLSLSGSNSSTSSHDVRTNLLATPVTVLDQHARTSNRGRFGTAELALEVRTSARTSAWASVTGTAWRYDGDGSLLYALQDSAQATLSQLDQLGTGGDTRRSGEAEAGFRFTPDPQRHELTVEARAARGTDDTDARYTNRGLDTLGQPAPSGDRLTADHIAASDRQLTLRTDYVRPLGKPRQLQAGVGLLDRRIENVLSLDIFAPALAAVPLTRTPGGYLHRERFESAYATLRQELGAAAVEAGLRLEEAQTHFRVATTGQSYDDAYLTVFPSVSLSVPLGAGRRFRLAYSKRVERPVAYLLNPDVPVTDSLNRTQGNPALQPKFTHNLTADLTWSGSRGVVRISPFFRRVIRNWDQIKEVDARGVSILTWANVAALTSYGAYVSASLPGDRRLGGYASLGAFREERDASNLSTLYSGSALRWSAGANGTFKATPSLTLLANASWSPPRELPQGRISATFVSGLGLRKQLARQAQVTLTVTDPCALWRYSFETRDWTHAQTSSNRFSMRGATLYFSYSFGKPPRTHRPTPTEPQQPQPDVRIH